MNFSELKIGDKVAKVIRGNYIPMRVTAVDKKIVTCGVLRFRVENGAEILTEDDKWYHIRLNDCYESYITDEESAIKATKKSRLL